MSNRVSSFIPLAPEITKANIASQFSGDTIKVPLGKTASEVKLEKAEFDTKERKKLAKEGEAMQGGKFPIRNKKDLENAIHDVGRSNNPTKAKAWIKKRAKDLDCENCLPGSWEKATEDELNMFSGELEKGGEGSKGGKVIGHTKSGKPIYAGHEASHKDYKNWSGTDHHHATMKHEEESLIHQERADNMNKKQKEENPHDYQHHTKMAEHHQNKADEHWEKHKELEKRKGDDKTEKSLKSKLKKDDSAGDGGEEMEESVEKAFDSLFGIDNSDPIDKAFESVVGVTTDPIEKAFENLLEKGGKGSGRKIGSTRSGKSVYENHAYNHSDYDGFTKTDHYDASKLHEENAAKGNDSDFHARSHSDEHMKRHTKMIQKIKLKNQLDKIKSSYNKSSPTPGAKRNMQEIEQKISQLQEESK